MKSKYVQRTFYFYKVSISNECNLSFEDIINKVKEEKRKERIRKIYIHDIYLYRVREQLISCKISDSKYEDQNFLIGTFIKCRNIDLQPRVKNDGETKENILASDEIGFGERSSFLYHSPTKTLVFQNNTNGASIDDFLDYFQSFLSEKFTIEAPRIMSLDALRRIKNNKIRKLSIQIAGLDNPGSLSTEDTSINDVLKMAETLKSPSINIEFSVQQKISSSLDHDRLSRLLESLSNLPVIGTKKDDEKEEVTKGIKSVKAVAGGVGRGSRGSSQIDMLGSLMYEKENIKIDEGCSLNHTLLEEAAIESWSKRQVEIFEMNSQS